MAKIKLTQVVAEFLDSKDTSSHEFRRLYNIAVRGAREFNMDITGQFKSALLDVSANYTVAFPKDYLQYSKLGILNGVGEVITLKHNPDLATLHQAYLASQMQVEQVPTDTGLITFGSPTQFPSFYWFNFGYSGASYHLYGVPGGTATIGEFTIDEVNKCFLLQTGWPYSTIMLEYLSDGFDCECDEYMVDTFASEAMICYLRWKNAQDLHKKYSTGDVRYFKSEYYRERNISKMRINQVNIAEMQNVFRSHVTLTAKA